MRTVIIAVGSTRRPKLQAVSEALATIGPLLDLEAHFELAEVDVPSGVGHTPLCAAETMAGARNRAQALRTMATENDKPWAYFVGLEGGLDIHEGASHRQVFLENWAYVLDRGGRGAFGRSGSVLLPDALAKLVVDDGIELAKAVDDFAGGRGIRDQQGAWGVLTRGAITRQEAFRIAVVSAFATFYNPGAYRDSARATSQT
jgi:inosine/xanthosine triphosphatase